MHWTDMTPEQERDALVKKLVVAGLAFSKYLRYNETHSVAYDNFPGNRSALKMLASMYAGDKPLINWEHVADLNQFVRVYPDQAYWSGKKWESEIRRRMR